ncbi:alpha/beta hydrolase [Paenibacillus thiaminolyticus]|uniref:alpha/beta fold hydrolase n=1 Tax=Paenibacillus thiaminolyticus TaxID=49283 RepID=UPI00232E9DE2|nr:alpha/beta fold hydrolase [Paenibacillus thiaminolyticus]WCF08652.1 alpha/beta hydrolase [Paenibacillus thiaminolyticus]
MNLYLQQLGVKDAPLLVFLHGGGVSGWMWEKQLEYFKGRYHIVIPDLPGHGKSKDIPFHSICQTAQSIIQLIDMHREGRQVTVVGFSLGAQIALEMLGMREDVADHAVIVSGLAKPMKLGYSLLAPLLRMSYPLVKNRSFAQLQARQLRIGPEQFERYYQESLQMKRDTFMAMMQENMSYRLPEGFARNRARILVMAGEKERKVMKDSAAFIARSHPGAEGYLVPAAGHDLPLGGLRSFHLALEAWMSGGELPPGMNRIR